MFTSFLTKKSSQWVLFSRVSYFLKLKQKCRWKRGEDHLNIWRLISGEIKSFVVRTRPSQSPPYTSYDHVRLSASSTVIGAIPFLRLLTDSSHFSLALIHLWLVTGRRNELLLHETCSLLTRISPGYFSPCPAAAEDLGGLNQTRLNKCCLDGKLNSFTVGHRGSIINNSFWGLHTSYSLCYSSHIHKLNLK